MMIMAQHAMLHPSTLKARVMGTPHGARTVADEVVNPFGGRGASGNGTSIGGPGDWEEFTQWQWVTIKNDAPTYPL